MSRPLWKLSHVSLAGAQRPRLDDVSLEILPGTTAVVGWSGAGKTSLLNVLVGFERAEGGREEARYDENDSDRLGLFWVPQGGGLWPHLTGREHLFVVVPADKTQAEKVENFLHDFDLDHVADVRPERMSQGERARLSVARALASGARVLVMDEPLVHVDPARVGKYWDIVRTHCRTTDTSLVFATHAPEIVLREAEHAVCLHEGRVLYAGSVEALYHRPDTPELAAFLGASNWFSPADRSRWLELKNLREGEAPAEPESIDARGSAGASPSHCVRPERLQIEPVQQSPLIVEAAHFAGSVEEVEIRHEPTQTRRRFYHRPATAQLRTGDRVLLRICVLLCLLLIAGCGSAKDVPTIAVKRETHWSLPPDGPSVPAPRGVHVGPDHELYVLDNAGRVLVFDAERKLARQWRMPESSVGKPEKLCVFKDGRVAIADTHYHRIIFFDKSGVELSRLGVYGKGPSEFIYPVAIVQDGEENFYVCEYGENDRVQKFSLDGKFLLEFGGFGTATGEFQRPSGIVWRDKKLYVVDAFNNRIQVFSEEGKFLEVLGSGDAKGDLNYPYDIATNAAGELVVVEYGAGRVSQFDLTGKLLGRFGTTGTGEGQMNTPWGLSVDGADRIVIADTGNRRIVELVR